MTSGKLAEQPCLGGAVNLGIMPQTGTEPWRPEHTYHQRALPVHTSALSMANFCCPNPYRLSEHEREYHAETDSPISLWPLPCVIHSTFIMPFLKISFFRKWPPKVDRCLLENLLSFFGGKTQEISSPAVTLHL